MKKTFLLALLSLTVFILGMSEPAHIPPELKGIKVKVVDLKGVVHQLTSFQCGDGASLKLKKGSIDYSLSISQVSKIEVLGTEDGASKVKVVLKDGKEGVFEISTSMRCSALSDMGSVSFYINEVKSIELLKGE